MRLACGGRHAWAVATPQYIPLACDDFFHPGRDQSLFIHLHLLWKRARNGRTLAAAPHAATGARSAEALLRSASSNPALVPVPGGRGSQLWHHQHGAFIKRLLLLQLLLRDLDQRRAAARRVWTVAHGWLRRFCACGQMKC